jgi:hypothetical protein
LKLKAGFANLQVLKLLTANAPDLSLKHRAHGMWPPKGIQSKEESNAAHLDHQYKPACVISGAAGLP